MKTFHFDTWREFRAFVDEDESMWPRYWRGQRDPAWPLASRFERILLGIDGSTRPRASIVSFDNIETNPYKVIRDGYLERFQRAASGLRGPNPKQLSTEEWWALGRHYGLVTPLLDWTEKPYIAAFFALSDLKDKLLYKQETDPYKGEEVAIYKLIHKPELENIDLQVVRPVVDELGRLQSQRGVFTWLDSEEHFELQSYLDYKGCGDLLLQIIISGGAVRDGLKDLDNHGIDYRLIFPDLSGAALTANSMGLVPAW